jgi:hypothetical protein
MAEVMDMAAPATNNGRRNGPPVRLRRTTSDAFNDDPASGVRADEQLPWNRAEAINEVETIGGKLWRTLVERAAARARLEEAQDLAALTTANTRIQVRKRLASTEGRITEQMVEDHVTVEPEVVKAGYQVRIAQLDYQRLDALAAALRTKAGLVTTWVGLLAGLHGAQTR